VCERRVPRWAVLAAALLGNTLAFAQASRATGDPRPATLLHEAILAAQAGDGGKALRLTTTLLGNDPNYEPALKFEGALLEDMGEPRQAAAAFRKAYALAPNDSELMLKVGTYDLVDGDAKQAIALLNHRLKLAPHDRDALYYLAQAYHVAGENELALKTIKAATREDPQNPSLWQKYGELLCSSGDAAAALPWLNKAKAADPTLEQIDLDLAVASFNNQDLDNALKSATAAAERQPNDARALTLLGSIDIKLAHWQEAEPVYQRVLTIKSDDTASLLGLGHAELELKKYQLAADSLERVLAQDPTLILAHFYLSRAYAGLGRTEEAQHEALVHRNMLEQQATLAPKAESPDQQAAMAHARQLLTDNREADALQLFRESKAGFTESPGSAYGLVAAVYGSMDRPEDATRCLHQALRVEPGVRGAHTSLGMLALQQSEFDRAESEFNQELAAHPNDQMATAEIGEIRYRQGRWAEAADRIAQSKTAVPALLYMLCDSYFHLGKVQDADVTAELIADYSKGDRAMLGRVVALLERNQQDELAKRLSKMEELAS
jgi:predicted Zn-dependent protease